MRKTFFGIAIIATILSSALTGCIVRHDRYHHDRHHDHGRHGY